MIISEARNEVRDFAKWGFDIIPHRALMKRGFETADGGRVDVETAFKSPEHPFRVAIVCAMWLTGFDVECLSTLYVDKPMKAHSLMQAIARANRVWPGKDFGLIVDYNGMLKSLREALAQYALGDDDGDGGEEIVAPVEERVQALVEAVEATEAHLRGLGFDPATLIGTTGFTRIGGLRDAVEAVYTSDEAKRRFEVLARQVFVRFKALAMEPSAFPHAERHDNLEAIYKKLSERRDTADVTELLKELHRIVNEAVRTQAPGDDQAEGLTFDLSRIDMERLRDEFAKKVRHKATALRDIREIVEEKLAQMLARNPSRMDYQQKYEEIVADYNREKDRVTVEETFRRLTELIEGLDAEQRRAVEEGLSEDELALFDLLEKEDLGRAARERVKQASRDLLASIQARLKDLDRFWRRNRPRRTSRSSSSTRFYANLPTPPFTPEEERDGGGRGLHPRLATGRPRRVGHGRVAARRIPDCQPIQSSAVQSSAPATKRSVRDGAPSRKLRASSTVRSMSESWCAAPRTPAAPADDDVYTSFAHPGAERIVELVAPGPARTPEIHRVPHLSGMEVKGPDGPEVLADRVDAQLLDGLVDAVAETLRHLRQPLRHPIALENRKGGHRGGEAQGVSVEGAGVEDRTGRRQQRDEVPPSHQRRDYVPIRDGLAERGEIGLHAVHRPHSANIMAEPAHDLVENEDRAVPVAECASSLQIRLVQDHAASAVERRLDHQGGDFAFVPVERLGDGVEIVDAHDHHRIRGAVKAAGGDRFRLRQALEVVVGCGAAVLTARSSCQP